MTAAPLDLYDSAITAHTGNDGCRCLTWSLRYADGRLLPLALGRWCSEPDDVDLEILARCTDPTLDIGCGPGRLVAALSAAGRDALGVDIAGAAVRLARGAGASVVQRSVFDSLPDEGRWGTALLIDGNIGIGGDPVALLRRCRDLVAVDGTTVVELDPPGESSAVQVRLESHRRRSHWFNWAHVVANEITGPAEAAGLRVVDSWATKDRWFARLAR
jgi:SAM-dependent methyltransferase